MVSALVIAGCAGQGGDVTAETTARSQRSVLRRHRRLPCRNRVTCVDDPSDGCNPNNGGADCGGICVRDKSRKPEKKYVSRDPNQCAAILFSVKPAASPSSTLSGCGCACAGTTDVCADPLSRTYVTHDPYECQLIKYSCASGVGFSDECGCGCIN